MLSKSLIQFSFDRWDCVSTYSGNTCSLAWGQTMIGVMALMATPSKRTYSLCCGSQDCCSQCPWLHSRPLLTHASAGDSWTLTGKSCSVSCGVTAPFSWVLVHPRFCLCPSRVSVSSVLWKFCNQIPLTFKVRFPGDTQSLCQIPRLGSLLWGLEF